MDVVSDLTAVIGESPAFLALLDAVSRLAVVDRPVLVVGERGTGKELIAQRLHFLSPRWDAPLVKINCAALPESLLETELFGHEAGAFTGAVRRRIGRFERADTGTLFLDEIGNAPASVQEKVLRVVEYGTFERVGSSATITVDVRVVAATNVDLPAEARAGRFRHDLLDRLAFDVLTVPPLRARAEDVRLLAEHFTRGMAAELGWPIFDGFTEAALAALVAHGWPGNVREIKNAAERAVYRWPEPGTPIAEVPLDPFDSPYRPGPAPIEAEHEPQIAEAVADAPPESLPADLDAAVADYESGLLERALAATRFNQREAARRVGLRYHQFRNRLRRHGMLGSPSDT